MKKAGNKKILIVGTQPFNRSNQSRAFDSYFHLFPNSDLLQIFSDARVPCKGHCSKLFQIKDIDLLKKVFLPWHKAGKCYFRDDLKEAWTKDEMINPYSPKKRGTISYWLRKILWRKCLWKSSELEKLVSEFKPDVVFISFSYDFFILKIGEYFSKKYDIPIVISIADDLIFRGPIEGIGGKAYHKLFIKNFLSLIKNNRVFGVFESEKIKEKYTQSFGMDGEVVYIASALRPRRPSPIVYDGDFYYFGNLEYGRFETLKEIATCIADHGLSSKLHVYSSDYEMYCNQHHSPSLILHKAVPYSEVLALMDTASFLVAIESFNPKFIDAVRYSLSTKVADCLCSGKPVFAYGARGTGMIDFIAEKRCCFFASSVEGLDRFFDSYRNRSLNYTDVSERQFQISNECFTLLGQASKFFDLVQKL